MEKVKNELLGLPLRQSTSWLESPRLPPAFHLPRDGFTREANRESVPLGLPPAPQAPVLAGLLPYFLPPSHLPSELCPRGHRSSSANVNRVPAAPGAVLDAGSRQCSRASIVEMWMSHAWI